MVYDNQKMNIWKQYKFVIYNEDFWYEVRLIVSHNVGSNPNQKNTMPKKLNLKWRLLQKEVTLPEGKMRKIWGS